MLLKRKRFSELPDDELEQIVSFCSRWENICAYSVAIGVFLELLTIHEFLQSLLPFWSHDIPTAIIGAGIVFEIRFSRRAHRASDVQIGRLKKEAAEANERAAKALERSMPRRIDRRKFAEAIAGKPTFNAEIVFASEDQESYDFGLQFKWALDAAKWNVIGIREMNEEDVPESPFKNTDKPMSYRATFGFGGVAFIVANVAGLNAPTDTPHLTVLREALAASTTNMKTDTVLASLKAPKGLIRIVITPRVWY